MKNAFAVVAVALSLAFVTVACSPDVGSKEWCEQIKKKDKGKLTADEAKNFAKHCLLK